MTFTNIEKDTLLMILKTEITEVEDLIVTADEADKVELSRHLIVVKDIETKFKNFA